MDEEFSKAISSIKNKEWSFLVKDFFNEEVPEYFEEEQASSTGKYHPELASQKGGLLRHTIGALEIAESKMSGMKKVQFDDKLKDEVRIAILVHDAFKFGTQERYDKETKEKGKCYTVINHGTIAAKKFFEFAKDIIAFIDLRRICVAIECHMGAFEDRSNRAFPIIGPEDEDVVYFTQIADFLISLRNMPKSIKAENMYRKHLEAKG